MSEKMEAAREALKVQRDAGETRQVEMNLIVKAKDNPKSMRAAINATCFSCLGGTTEEMPDPGWRRDIKECSSPDCPLFGFRPYK